MQETVRAALRMRDVALALLSCRQEGVTLNRIALQKLLYLADALTFVFELLPPMEGHDTYKHGPYDRYIQNAADCLCFRGIAQIVRAVQVENVTSTEYSLTTVGEAWAKRLTSDVVWSQRWELVERLGRELSKTRQWSRLRELVYAEPTFVAAKPSGWGQPLDIGNPARASAAGLIQLAQLALKEVAGREPSRALLVSIFIKYLIQNADQG